MDDDRFRKTLGARLRRLRMSRGYDNQREFAALIGLDGPALSRIERGQRGVDTLILQRAAILLEVSLDEFFVTRNEVALARSGDVEDPAMQEMLAWASTMQRNFGIVEDYGRSRT